MRRRVPAVLLALGLILESAAAALAAPPLPDAIGRLNTGGRGHCTAVLVAPDRVVTAAHCLYDAVAGRWYAPAELVFLAGYDRERYTAQGRGRTIRMGDRRPPQARANLEGIQNDWAIVVLEAPLDVEPLETARWHVSREARADRRALPTVAAGFARPATHALTVKSDCRPMSAAPDTALLVHRCGMDRGASGGPILGLVDGRWKLLAIQTAVQGPSHQPAYGLAIAMDGIPDTGTRASNP
jgi:protease YdgD